MKTQLLIEFDSESEFDSETVKAHLDGPRLMNALADYCRWIFKQDLNELKPTHTEHKDKLQLLLTTNKINMSL